MIVTIGSYIQPDERAAVCRLLEGHDLVLDMSLIKDVVDDYEIIGAVRSVRYSDGLFTCLLDIKRYKAEITRLDENFNVTVDVLRDKAGNITGLIPIIEKGRSASLSESFIGDGMQVVRIHEITERIFD